MAIYYQEQITLKTLECNADNEHSMEEVPHVNACIRHHRRKLLPQLELLSDDHLSAEILQRRISLRHSQGKLIHVYCWPWCMR
jgi:hypothetical protein